MSAPQRRILLYSAGRSGIGQTVRAARLARYASDVLECRAKILIVTGVASGDRLFGSPRWTVAAPAELVRVVTAVAEGAGQDHLARLRSSASRVVAALAEDFRPDIFISTSHRGVTGEINEVVETMRQRGCRLVLALRDIYYPPEFVNDFRSMPVTAFDLVLIGGPSLIRDWAPSGLLEGPLEAKAHFVGYLRPPGPQPRRPSTGGEPLRVRCQVGGGRDGAPLAKAVLEAIDCIRGRSSQLVELCLATGPLMSRSDVQALKSMSCEHTQVRIWSGRGADAISRVVPRPHVVVSMAGYNSCVEAAWSQVPSVLVPRDDPDDHEQVIRARLFSQWFPNIAVAPNADPAGLTSSISSGLFGGLADAHVRPSVAPDGVFALPRDVALNLIGQR